MSVSRYYPVRELSFEQLVTFADLLQQEFPAHVHRSYDLRYMYSEYRRDIYGATAETIRKRLSKETRPIRKYEATLSDKKPGQGERSSIRLAFRAIPTSKDHRVGLTLYASDLGKMDIYVFEQKLLPLLDVSEMPPPQYPMGDPCEALSVVVDMRGFTAFCEKPEVESPYVSAMLSGFYALVQSELYPYPPDVTKSLGDGMLALWIVENVDRAVAIQNAVAGLCRLMASYKDFRTRPEFIHGVPEEIGAGVSLGLASRFANLEDYTGRSVILSTRLCAICPGNHILVDKAISGFKVEHEIVQETVRLKSFGEFPVWRIGPVS